MDITKELMKKLMKGKDTTLDKLCDNLQEPIEALAIGGTTNTEFSRYYRMGSRQDYIVIGQPTIIVSPQGNILVEGIGHGIFTYCENIGLHKPEDKPDEKSRSSFTWKLRAGESDIPDKEHYCEKHVYIDGEKSQSYLSLFETNTDHSTTPPTQVRDSTRVVALYRSELEHKTPQAPDEEREKTATIK